MFSTDFTKSTFSKKMRKNVNFGSVFGGRNDEKSRKNGVEKHILFNVDFYAFVLRILAILGRFWEARAPPKIVQKSKKTVLKNMFLFDIVFYAFFCGI